MNKRIQELAIQAAGKGLNTFATSDFDSQEKIEKFAVLIVNECSNWLKQPVNQTPFSAENMNISAIRLKEYFGIQE